MTHVDKIKLEEMLKEIREEAEARDVDDIDWIIDTFNHLFGTEIT